MNCIYLLFFVFCMVGSQGAETFSPFSEMMKSGKLTTGGKVWKRSVLGMLQGPGRNMQRNSGSDDHCLMAMMCPSTEIQFPTGTLGSGFHFGVETLESVCNYTAQYLDCFDMLSASFSCGEMSTLMAGVFHVLQESVCHQPWTPGMFGPFSEMMKSRQGKLKTGDNMWNPKRSLLGILQGRRRNADSVLSNMEDHCLMATGCTSGDNLVEPTRNPEFGVHVGEEVLYSVCNFTGQYLQCYDMLSDVTNCGEVSTLIAHVFELYTQIVCHEPLRPEIRSLLECINNRQIQQTVLQEVQRLHSIDYSESQLPVDFRAAVFCQEQLNSTDIVLQAIETECGADVHQTVCEIEARFESYLYDFPFELLENSEIVCRSQSNRCRRGKTEYAAAMWNE